MALVGKHEMKSVNIKNMFLEEARNTNLAYCQPARSRQPVSFLWLVVLPFFFTSFSFSAELEGANHGTSHGKPARGRKGSQIGVGSLRPQDLSWTSGSAAAIQTQVFPHFPFV